MALALESWDTHAKKVKRLRSDEKAVRQIWLEYALLLHQTYSLREGRKL